MTVFPHPTLAKFPMALKSQSPLLRLPFEIRDMIYRHLTFLNNTQGSPQHIIFSLAHTTHGSDPCFPHFLPAICGVNEAMRIEIGLWFIRDVEFGIMYPQHIVYIRQFLSTFSDNQGFEAIRRLDFPLFGRHTPKIANGMLERNPFVESMKDCPGLVDVRIKFEVWCLVRRHLNDVYHVSPELGEENGVDLLPEPEIIAEEYDLHGMFELQSLSELSLEIWPRMVMPTYGRIGSRIVDCWPAMEELGQWFKQGFQKREKKVDVFLISSTTSGLRWTGGRSGDEIFLNSRHVM